MFRYAIVATALLAGTPAYAQRSGAPNPVAEMDWGLSAHSYAMAAACARKQFAFSAADVEQLKAIAIEKANGIKQAAIDKGWETIVFGLQYSPPTAAQCFDAYEKETFTGNNLFGF